MKYLVQNESSTFFCHFQGSYGLWNAIKNNIYAIVGPDSFV